MSKCEMLAITRNARIGSYFAICGLIWILMQGGPAFAAGACSHTADMASRACGNELRDDYWIALGNCENVSDDVERSECRQDAWSDRHEAWEVCGAQRSARLELCDQLGEDRYDPDFDPADFETEFTGQNEYWPLVPGYSWTFVGGSETINVEVLDKTKLIGGVTCIVVRDLVEEGGEAIEDTFDWYGAATNGDVWYCGEIALNFETFAGDDPEEAEVTDVEGSWKAGRDDAKAGVTMFAFPMPGKVYRQEMSLGNAEDAAEVIAIDYGYGKDAELDHLVPQALAELLCDDDCLITREFTPVAPGVEALKYYAPGIGLFLEVEHGEIVQLTGCNVDPRCAMLPAP